MMFRIGFAGNLPPTKNFLNYADGHEFGPRIELHGTSAAIFHASGETLRTQALYENVGLMIDDDTGYFSLGIQLDPAFTNLSMLCSAFRRGGEMRLCKSADPEDLIDQRDARMFTPYTAYELEVLKVRLYDATHLMLSVGSGESKIFELTLT